MNSTSPRELVLQFYQHFDDRQVEKALAMLSPDFVAHMAGLPKALDKQGFTEFGLEFYNAFSQGSHSFDEVIVQENKIVTCGQFRAKHTGSFQGLPPTGKEIAIDVMHIDLVESEKIVTHWGQGDAQGLMQQLGIVFLPGPGLLLNAVKQQIGLKSRLSSINEFKNFQAQPMKQAIKPAKVTEGAESGHSKPRG